MKTSTIIITMLFILAAMGTIFAIVVGLELLHRLEYEPYMRYKCIAAWLLTAIGAKSIQMTFPSWIRKSLSV
ncbi:MAG TPA: hypothetical protein VF438_03205 [Candidatus Paceibacterota bacterium]